MSHLGKLLSDPKALVARMRVGNIEPTGLSKAVAKLEERNSANVVAHATVAEVQQRIADLAPTGEMSQLSRRELREGCKAILHQPFPPAADSMTLNALLSEVDRNKRRAAFFAVIDAYLDGFSSDDETVLSLAHKLRTMSETWPWRESDAWPGKFKAFALLEPSRAPGLLAERILTAGADAGAIFREAGLDTAGRRFGGLAESVFRAACHRVKRLTGQSAVEGQRTLINFAANDKGKFAFPRVWPEFVEASLSPWEIVEPSEAHKSALIEMLERFGEGDPRAKPQLWRVVMDKAPGAYAVLMRWLTRASVLQFLDIVDRLMPDSASKLMWDYRRAFWMSYLLSDGNSPGIDAAWVAFGDEGARLATNAARSSGDRSFASFGRQVDKTSQHAALILQMGDLTIVDWSHSAKYQVWRRGDKGIPQLFQQRYSNGALYSAPIQESHISPSTYSWQKKLASLIEGRAILTPKPTWKPKRV